MKTKSITDELIKPDMHAVLARTHISVDLNGFLLPVFEAISNAMDAIEAHYQTNPAQNGDIRIRFTHANDPKNLTITVIDNGVGLDDDNYSCFKVPFSGHKLNKHGRGFGRFIAFKVFQLSTYLSHYSKDAALLVRSFKFDVAKNKEFTFLNEAPDLVGTGVHVRFERPLDDWHELIRSLKADDVADAIGSHFLPHFLYGWTPRVTIQFDNDQPRNITDHFKNVFVESYSGKFTCDIDSKLEELQYSVTRAPKTRSFKNHCLLFSAADRIVGAARDLTNKLGPKHFEDKDHKKYIVLAVVRSPAFESRLNDARTGLNLTTKVVENIVSQIAEVIESKEAAQIDKLKTEQTSSVQEALRENPILKLGLKGKTVKEYVTGKPNNWSAENFVSDLAIERFRASSELTKAISQVAADPEQYRKKLRDLVGRLDETRKEALAEYVLHRKSVIELVEAARRFGDDQKRPPEDVIHELVFRRFTDNVALSYFDHNLWLIDDALAFLPYISSDRTMHGGGRKKGDKVTDIAFFDDSMVLGDNDGTTLTIVEFKRPSRDDYVFGNPKADPVLQVVDTLEQATAKGGITKTDGTQFNFSGVVRRFAFIVADHTASMVKVLERHDFKNDWNPKIFYRFRDTEQISIHAFGYDTLIENAKKRNQAFFSVLMGE